MTIWDEAFEVLSSEAAETVVYHASATAAPRTFARAVFDELPAAEIRDDAQGRGERRRGLLQLPLADVHGPVTIAVEGQAWFVIRGQRWIVEHVQRERGAWFVTLSAVLDQAIRRAQRSTRT